MPHVDLGFHCSHEQLPPSALLRHAKLAGQAGFIHGMCSDHFHPWSERQGHAGYAWSWLASALEGTSLSWGTVCAPGQRYHPALIAQAAATISEIYGGRFWLAIGTGEALNEAITGEGWPAKDTRQARLSAGAEIMRTLWAGDVVSAQGPIHVKNARVYSRPAHPPALFGAALTPDTARWVGSWADGLITVAGPRRSMQAIVDAFREGGGAAKPMFLQVALSYAPTQGEAEAAAYDQWRHCALAPQLLADLESPADFDRHSNGVAAEDVFARVRASADIGRQIAWLNEDREMGFDRLYLHNVARTHQELFLDACGTSLLPAFNA